MLMREHVPRLRLVPGTRQAMLGEIGGERGEASRDLIMPLEIEALHQSSAIASFVRMVDEEIE